ncbi:MAG TPA: hypothetical protein VIK59_13330 [Verrucomicrobiae bacterium]
MAETIRGRRFFNHLRQTSGGSGLNLHVITKGKNKNGRDQKEVKNAARAVEKMIAPICAPFPPLLGFHPIMQSVGRDVHGWIAALFMPAIKQVKSLKIRSRLGATVPNLDGHRIKIQFSVKFLSLPGGSEPFIFKSRNSMKTKILSLLFVPLFFTGCASIIDGGSKSVHINSNPEGAKVTISNKSGREICVQTTPAIVTLERSSGYFRGEDYKIVFEQAGYYSYETHIKSTIDGWYFGNIIFGGPIGILIVDPATGDMFTLAPRDLNFNLVSSAIPLTPDGLKAAELKANPVSIPKSRSANPRANK